MEGSLTTATKKKRGKRRSKRPLGKGDEYLSKRTDLEYPPTEPKEGSLAAFCRKERLRDFEQGKGGAGNDGGNMFSGNFWKRDKARETRLPSRNRKRRRSQERKGKKKRKGKGKRRKTGFKPRSEEISSA